uniref:Zinc finger CCCH domain-containing protein 6 n=1 Tax=Macrostomum lignano TaxID=282301 RepID=A0A1I8HCK2_9PLAT
MMTSELDSLPADLEDGEIDASVDSANEEGPPSGSKEHSNSKHKSRGKRKSSDSMHSNSGQNSKSKKAKISKSKDKSKSSRRRQHSEGLDQPQQPQFPDGFDTAAASNASAAAGFSYGFEDDEYYRREGDDRDFQGYEDLNVAVQESLQREPSAANSRSALSFRKPPPKRRGQRKSSSNMPGLARKKQQKPLKSEPPVCSFYMEGRCNKGENCPFSHTGQVPKKPLLCKFYAMGACLKSDSECLFMHSEFPCKYFHLGGFCRLGKECRFSHEPLSAEMRSALLSDNCAGEQADATDEDRFDPEAAVPHQPTEPKKQDSLLGPAPHLPRLQSGQEHPEDEHVNSESRLTLVHQQHPHCLQPEMKQEHQQPFKQLHFPPRPFPHPGDAENQTAPAALQLPLPQQHRPPLLPPPASSSGGLSLTRPAYSGPEPPARPFPSAPPRLQPRNPPLPPPRPPMLPPTKPTPVAVAAASRALDAVASLLSEFCTGSSGSGGGTEDTEASAQSPTMAVCKEEVVEDSEPMEQQRGSGWDSDDKSAASSRQTALVFRAPPICKRRLPWRLLPLDPIDRLPYSLMQLPSSVVAESIAGNDPRLTGKQQQPPPPPQKSSSLLDPRIRNQHHQQQHQDSEGSQSGRSGRLQLNERSAASAVEQQQQQREELPARRDVFDPRFRRRVSQQDDGGRQ